MGVLFGGPALSTLLSVQGERSVGLSSVVLTYDVDKRKDRLIDSSSFIYLVARPKERRFAYSSSFRKALKMNRLICIIFKGYGNIRLSVRLRGQEKKINPM